MACGRRIRRHSFRDLEYEGDHRQRHVLPFRAEDSETRLSYPDVRAVGGEDGHIYVCAAAVDILLTCWILLRVVESMLGR